MLALLMIYQLVNQERHRDLRSPFSDTKRGPLRTKWVLYYLLFPRMFTLCIQLASFSIYRKMIKLYYDLDTIRFRLSMNLTTEAEKINLIRAATSLRTKIAKFLSSTYRKNKLIANSTPRNPDPYGFEGIFARDIDTGELLSYEIDKLRTLSVIVNALWFN